MKEPDSPTVFNLILVALLVAGIEVWLHLFTDWWLYLKSPVGFLTLASLLLGLTPFLNKTLRKWGQTRIWLAGDWLLNSQYSTATIVLMWAVVAVFLSGFGTIRLDTRSSEDLRGVKFGDDVREPYNCEDGFEGYLAESTITKTLKWAWWFGRDVWVKIHGIPKKRVYVRGFFHLGQVYQVPKAFLDRPAAIVFPEENIKDDLESGGLSLAVCISGRPAIQKTDYRGSPFWVGVMCDVEVPRELNIDVRSDVLGREIDLSRATSLTVALWNSDPTVDAPFAEGSVDFTADEKFGGFAFKVELLRTAGTDRSHNCQVKR